MTTLPLGDTGDLLRRRPDVRAAERQLAAATAREGIAAADLYPRVSISGVLGFLAGRGNLFGQRRIAAMGGDAGAELGRHRPGQRAGAAAWHRGGDA